MHFLLSFYRVFRCTPPKYLGNNFPRDHVMLITGTGLSFFTEAVNQGHAHLNVKP